MISVIPPAMSTTGQNEDGVPTVVPGTSNQEKRKNKLYSKLRYIYNLMRIEMKHKLIQFDISPWSNEFANEILINKIQEEINKRKERNETTIDDKFLKNIIKFKRGQGQNFPVVLDTETPLLFDRTIKCNFSYLKGTELVIHIQKSSNKRIENFMKDKLYEPWRPLFDLESPIQHKNNKMIIYSKRVFVIDIKDRTRKDLDDPEGGLLLTVIPIENILNFDQTDFVVDFTNPTEKLTEKYLFEKDHSLEIPIIINPVDLKDTWNSDQCQLFHVSHTEPEITGAEHLFGDKDITCRFTFTLHNAKKTKKKLTREEQKKKKIEEYYSMNNLTASFGYILDYFLQGKSKKLKDEIEKKCTLTPDEKKNHITTLKDYIEKIQENEISFVDGLLCMNVMIFAMLFECTPSFVKKYLIDKEGNIRDAKSYTKKILDLVKQPGFINNTENNLQVFLDEALLKSQKTAGRLPFSFENKPQINYLISCLWKKILHPLLRYLLMLKSRPRVDAVNKMEDLCKTIDCTQQKNMNELRVYATRFCYLLHPDLENHKGYAFEELDTYIADLLMFCTSNDTFHLIDPRVYFKIFRETEFEIKKNDIFHMYYLILKKAYSEDETKDLNGIITEIKCNTENHVIDFYIEKSKFRLSQCMSNTNTQVMDILYNTAIKILHPNNSPDNPSKAKRKRSST